MDEISANAMQFQSKLYGLGAGGTLNMQAGTYTGTFVVPTATITDSRTTIKGTSGVIVDGQLNVTGKKLTVSDLRITDSAFTSRVVAGTGATAAGGKVAFKMAGEDIYGLRLWIHDCLQGASGFGGAFVLRDCVFKDIGFEDGNAARWDHAVYANNAHDSNGTRYFDNCVFVGNWRANMSLYGDAAITNWVFTRCIFIDSGYALFGGEAATGNITIEDCVFWDCWCRCGYELGGNPQNGTYTLNRNRFYLAEIPLTLNKLTVEGDGNVIYAPDAAQPYTATSSVENWTAPSVYAVAPADNVVVNVSADLATRANLIIENWSLANSVNVSLTGMPHGSYKLTNAQNWSETATIDWQGSPVAVTVNTLTRSKPQGSAVLWYSSTMPRFVVFIVEEA